MQPKKHLNIYKLAHAFQQGILGLIQTKLQLMLPQSNQQYIKELLRNNPQQISNKETNHTKNSQKSPTMKMI